MDRLTLLNCYSSKLWLSIQGRNTVNELTLAWAKQVKNEANEEEEEEGKEEKKLGHEDQFVMSWLFDRSQSKFAR